MHNTIQYNTIPRRVALTSKFVTLSCCDKGGLSDKFQIHFNSISASLPLFEWISVLYCYSYDCVLMSLLLASLPASMVWSIRAMIFDKYENTVYYVCGIINEFGIEHESWIEPIVQEIIHNIDLASKWCVCVYVCCMSAKLHQFWISWLLSHVLSNDFIRCPKVWKNGWLDSFILSKAHTIRYIL